ncbi:glycerol-3-phosphate dehydrogenase [nad(+)] gpdhc1 [Quercus suber]|uniref:Glycerol-3-phosphate dehydrogenase [nad(+)] gpdhc1 n=1 Tax=Quercus suber TaxID=58331 RepID=A0AAW0M4C1_QUESU
MSLVDYASSSDDDVSAEEEQQQEEHEEEDEDEPQQLPNPNPHNQEFPCQAILQALRDETMNDPRDRIEIAQTHAVYRPYLLGHQP